MIGAGANTITGLVCLVTIFTVVALLVFVLHKDKDDD